MRLTEQEGLVLSLAARLANPTTHELFVVLDGSPTRAIRASKGTIYPIVARLKARGYISATPANDGRRSEWLEVTPTGREAITRWLCNVDREHAFPYDPLRVRLPSLELLDREQQLEWIARVRQLNHEMRREIDGYQSSVEMSFAETMHRSAREYADAQLRWLDQLQISVLQGKREITPTRRK